MRLPHIKYAWLIIANALVASAFFAMRFIFIFSDAHRTKDAQTLFRFGSHYSAANAHTVQVIIKLFLLLNKRFSRISCALEAGKQKKRDVDNDDDGDKKENYGKK